MKVQCTVIFFILLFFTAARSAFPEMDKPAPLKGAAARDPSAQAPLPAIDFETYQKNIDDMFQVAFLKNAAMDQGINSAIVHLNRKIVENPQDPGPLISLGHVYRILGHPEEANHFYERALVLAPGNFHLNLFSAVTADAGKEPGAEKALERLDQALAIHPLDLFAWNARGRALMILGRFLEAEESFRKVLEIEPADRDALFGLSLLYQRTDQPAKALEAMEKIHAENPRDLSVRYLLGALSFEQGDVEKALGYWEALFKEGIRDPQFLFHFSIALLEDGEAEKSRRILEHLHFFFPREPEIELLTAESYRQLNRPQEAERRYRLLLAENPNYLSAYMGLAHLLERQGKIRERDEVLADAQAQAAVLRSLREEKEKLEAERHLRMDGYLPSAASS